MDYEPIATVHPATGFNAIEDASALRSAMKGFGTDEQAIIDVLTYRSNAQRQATKAEFMYEYGRDLIKDLKGEMCGKFEDLIIALLLTPNEYLCEELHKALDGNATEESTLVEILCTKNNEEVKELNTVYEEMYGLSLTEHMYSKTSGQIRRLLTLIVSGNRDPVGTVDADIAKDEAKALYNDGGEGRLGTEVFNRILAHDSFAQLRLVFEEYRCLAGMTIEEALQLEIEDELLEAINAIVECVQSPGAFFANRLFKAMDGMGTDDITLIRIIVSRSEIDLENIKQEFERLYNRTLLSAVKSETSGDYKRALCALIGDA